MFWRAFSKGERAQEVRAKVVQRISREEERWSSVERARSAKLKQQVTYRRHAAKMLQATAGTEAEGGAASHLL